MEAGIDRLAWLTAVFGAGVALTFSIVGILRLTNLRTRAATYVGVVLATGYLTFLNADTRNLLLAAYAWIRGAKYSASAEPWLRFMWGLMSPFLRDFSLGFLANAAGALVGVLLALLFERRRMRRQEDRQYGSLLHSCRFELNRARSICRSVSEGLRTRHQRPPQEFLFPVAATQAVVTSPLAHARATISLLNALATVSDYTHVAESGFQRTAGIRTTAELVKVLNAVLGSHLNRLAAVIEIALEQLSLEISRLGVQENPDPEWNDVTQRLQAALQRNEDGEEKREPT